eukprot:9487548-Pyramimonas_sp.AAC.1
MDEDSDDDRVWPAAIIVGRARGLNAFATNSHCKFHGFPCSSSGCSGSGGFLGPSGVGAGVGDGVWAATDVPARRS